MAKPKESKEEKGEKNLFDERKHDKQDSSDVTTEDETDEVFVPE